MIRTAIAVLVGSTLWAASMVPLGQSLPRPELPPCLTDEAESSYPCQWDAERQGNGQGRSFTLTDPDGDGYADHVTLR
jgi:hypothetical protein